MAPRQGVRSCLRRTVHLQQMSEPAPPGRMGYQLIDVKTGEIAKPGGGGFDPAQATRGSQGDLDYRLEGAWFPSLGHVMVGTEPHGSLLSLRWRHRGQHYHGQILRGWVASKLSENLVAS